LHVPFCYYPDPVGGTETYVAALAEAQQANGYEIAITAPGEKNQTYMHQGFPVHRFGVGSMSLRQLYGEGDPTAAANVEEILDRVRPDILHLHAFTGAVSPPLARSAGLRKIPVVFTYHTPTVTCCRGTMLEWGNRVCDGEMRVKRCTGCMLDGKGLPKTAGMLLGTLPPAAGRFAGTAGLKGGIWTALRSTELVAIRHTAVRRFLLEETDHIFAVCDWVRTVLVANGVPPGKITLSRQGTRTPSPLPAGTTARAASPAPSSPIRLAFLGRVDRVKGVDILIDALALLPRLEVRLDVFAVAQGEEARRLEKELVAKAHFDPRIRFMPPVAANDVVETLCGYDALLVPSQVLETGPLVIYEAFAAGIPVVGSALGGIAELVRNGETGLLVGERSATAWADAIRRLIEEPGLLRKLKAAPKPTRSAKDAAGDAAKVYAALLNPTAVFAGSLQGKEI
jgi:glycosyltransferase involved in cell wall biosynthesis